MAKTATEILEIMEFQSPRGGNVAISLIQMVRVTQRFNPPEGVM